MRSEVYMREAQSATEGLFSAMERGLRGIDGVPRAIRKILRRGYWRRRIVHGKVYTNTSFADYITKMPHQGIGQDPMQIRRLLWREPRILAMFERAMAGPHGGARTRQSPPLKSDNVTPPSSLKSDNVTQSQRGNSRAYTLRRLQIDRPDLFLRIERGEMSAHQAAKEAGYRKTLTPFQQVMKLLPKLTEPEHQALAKAQRILKRFPHPSDQQRRLIEMELRRLESQSR